MEMIAYHHSYWLLFILSSNKYLTNFKKPALILRVFLLHLIFQEGFCLKLKTTLSLRQLVLTQWLQPFEWYHTYDIQQQFFHHRPI